MIARHLCLAILLLGTFGFSQEGEIGFRLLRQDDEVWFLKGKEQRTGYERLKWMPLGSEAALSLGGSWRGQFESFKNEQFQNVPDQDNGWILNRFMFHSHFRIKNKFELYLELNSSVISSKEAITPVDKDELGINQLFARYRFSDQWDVLIGRQNMRLGSGRLIDIREGPNVRRSFDMAEINYSSENIKLKGFFSTIVNPQPGVLDNEFLDFDEILTGVYTTYIPSQNNNFDFYLLYQREDEEVFENAEGRDRRGVLGTRYSGKHGKMAFNTEAVYQFGKLEDQRISAWTLSAQLEYDISMWGKGSGLGIKTEIISGDRKIDDDVINTFDGLYPRGAYFGRVARFGPSNLIDIHPYINVNLGNWFIEFDYVAFWRTSTRDGVYNAPLILEYPNLNDERFIAHQLGGILGFDLNRFVHLELEANFIRPGSFLVESNRPDNLFHMVFTTEVRF